MGPAASGDRLRVWLEPAYDHGRYGAWLLDWPGAFVWAPTREAVLARAPSALGAHVDWLTEHGEQVPLPEVRGTDVIEAVPATVVDGYERNATFAADAAPVDADLLERLLRHAAWARDDLVEVAMRARAFEAAHGPLAGPPRGAEAIASGAGGGPRELDALLRHVAGADVWLASRLDRSARYEGGLDGDPETVLAAARAWAFERLRALQARDPALAGTDGKGEAWTLRKVLRRVVYHGLDHLEELDRRLALAEGRAAHLVWRHGAAVDLDELARLLALNGRAWRAHDRERLAAMLERATDVVSAWHGSRLVGIARAIHDGVSNGYVSLVYVHPRWQGRGVGRELMRRLMAGHEGVKYALRAAPGTESFYRSLGFDVEPLAMARPRRA